MLFLLLSSFSGTHIDIPAWLYRGLFVKHGVFTLGHLRPAGGQELPAEHWSILSHHISPTKEADKTKAGKGKNAWYPTELLPLLVKPVWNCKSLAFKSLICVYIIHTPTTLGKNLNKVKYCQKRHLSNRIQNMILI